MISILQSNPDTVLHWSISKGLAKHPVFDWRKYFKARFWRIAPLFYCGLLLAVILEWVVATWLNRVEVWPMPEGKLANVAGSLVFLQGFNVGYGSYAPSWSITYEIIYYIAWPVVLWWAGFRAHKAVLLSFGIAVGSMALFYGFWKWKPVFGDAFHIVLWQIPLASLMWILGAWCRQNCGTILSHKAFPALSRWWWVFVLGWMATSTTLSFLNVSLLGRVVLNPLVWLAVPLMVMADWRIALKPSGVAWFADLSYPLYLMHGPLLVFLASLLRTKFSSAPAWMVVLISSVVTFMIAATAGVTLERFFLNLRKRQAS
jgi:peptidoglycan/LPS O-acetylase OafA/YrhL